ncbi:diphosphate--fructose-6-phosphate 1-phosphotransferase [Chlamydia avium]|uniref:Probable ATP-dependent 6-phosphofructokinase n=1 Tax=Chlamydia avium TaxID=1457141 RepID=A0ABP2X5G1_9CHLA|nr:diphosphate--fructose-6-phosphate 1-phosphotransferase [Chlamydia avium]EPP36674.1 diphosphate--fructose-6-phosphate 1-phosphotransferase [Chlamydia psittaci 10_743_SC13]EPP38044.1 diphosphate--fructose-6-phosphate 1-phosphotransferase [Chlamydia avium]
MQLDPRNSDRVVIPDIPPLPRELQKFPDLVPTQDTRFSSPCDPQVTQLFPHTYNNPYLKFISGEPLSKKPIKVGVMLSGGPAPGGHNVIWGLLHSIKKIHSDSSLIGFINNGQGLIHNQTIEINEEFMASFRNSGGFHCIGTGRTNIITEENKSSILKTVKNLHLDGLVIIGGDGSNTATAILAEYFSQHYPKTCIVGVPKTIDGDLQHLFLDITFGFDSATKFYSSIISNISRDALSGKAHYHFIKLMGRSASHIALECTLQTHPNIALISEEIAEKNIPLKTIIHKMCSIIADRAAMGKYYGVVLIPEGLIEFIPEINNLVKEIEKIPEGIDKFSQLSQESQLLLKSFPPGIVHQLLHDRDAHGNVYVSKIHVNKLLIHLVSNHLQKHFKNVPFNAISHFLGYEGRSCIPTKFDNTYSYALGFGSGILVLNRCNGYLAAIESLINIVDKWRLRAIPIVKMFTTQKKPDGTLQPRIKKSLIDIGSPAFRKFKLYRKIWALEDSYRFLGPLQIHTPPKTHSDHFPPLTLLLNHNEWQKRCSICMEIPDCNY